jgi:opacity protein-like surface antigen
LGQEATELTPFLGLRFGGGFESLSTGDSFDVGGSASYGLIFDRPLSKETTFEFVWSLQDTELDGSGADTDVPSRIPLDVHYFHFGATYSPGEPRKRRGFAVMTAGATYFDPGGDFGSETRFSVAAGGGAKFKLSERLRLRVEGRGYLTFVDGSAAVFCTGGGAGGGCAFSFVGDAFVQGEINVGLSIGL